MKPNIHGIKFENSDDVLRVRDVLRTADYSESGIIGFLGGKVPLAPIAVEIPPMVLRTNGGSPLETLIRLFLLNVSTESDATRRALQPLSLEAWVEAGMVELKDDSVVPLVRLLPYQGFLLACDISRDSDPNMVMGLGGSSLALANSTIRKSFQSTLDLGTGCGIQSVLASTHSERVYAVDLNPRAIDFATFNAHLNGLTNIECFQGNLFDPVIENQFDLVVSNPPFVISPEFRAHYRDNELRVDQFCQTIVGQVPAFLNEGGYCQIICNWAHVKGQRWQDRLAGWCEGTGCDVWVMRKETREPSDYTMFWNRKKPRDGGFAQVYDNWMAYFAQERIEAISTGLLTMRRSSLRSNWFRAEDGPEKSYGLVGDDILRGFEAYDLLEGDGDDRAFLNSRLSLGPDVRLEQRLEPSAKAWRVVDAQLHRTRGLGYSGKVDPDTAELLLKCNGERQVGELLNDVAARRNVSLESISHAYLPVLRRLVSRGFLRPTSSMNGTPKCQAGCGPA